MTNPRRERKPAVTTERPHLSRSACNSGHRREEQQQDEQASKDTRCRVGLRCVVDDDYDWEITAVEVSFEIRDAKAAHVST